MTFVLLEANSCCIQYISPHGWVLQHTLALRFLVLTTKALYYQSVNMMSSLGLKLSNTKKASNYT